MAKKGKCLFACSTEYTILNAVNMELDFDRSYGKKSDIAIFTRTAEVARLREAVDKSDVFDNTYQFYFINKLNFVYLSLLFIFPKFILNYFFRQKKTSLMQNNAYDVIISQNILYAIIFRKFNRGAKIYLIEEGLSSYTGRTGNTQRRSKYFQFFNKYILKADLTNFISGHYLYRPEIYNGEHKKVISLPRLNPSNYDFYNKLFNYSCCDNYSIKPFIYLGVPFYGLKDLMVDPAKASPDFEDKCKLIVDSLLSFPNQSSFTYRKHPLETVNLINNKNHYQFDNCGNVWEMECQNKITDKHVIVSFFSTGSFSPKMLFDKEPYIIFLYKLLDVNFFNAEKLINDIKSIYRNPQKVIIVESLEHLSDAITRIEKHKV